MPEYRIEPTLKFLYKHLPNVPAYIRKQLFYDYLRKLQRDDSRTPFSENIKRLKGYVNLYRLRKGDYRLIYRIEGYRIICVDIGHRKKIYKKMKYDPGRELIIGISSDLPAYVEIEPDFQNYIENSGQKEIEHRKTPLPYPITSDLLDQWGVESEHHNLLQGISTEEELLGIEGKIPSDVFEIIFEEIFSPQMHQEIQEEMQGLLHFKCPIPGCDKVFENTRGGWDAHVAAARKHENWHPDVVDGTKRKQLFKKEFSDWFLFANNERQRPKVKWSEVLEFLQKYVLKGKVTTYGNLSQRFYDHTGAAQAIGTMLKKAITADHNNQQWTNRVVKSKGQCIDKDQKNQLQDEDNPFTNDGRVDLTKNPPVT